MSNFKNSMVLIVSMIFTIVALCFSASAGAPVVIPLDTIYEPFSGGIANEVTPNFTINVGIIDTGTGINTSNVIADVSIVSTVGTVLMDLNGSYAGIGNITYFTKTVKVDKVVRGDFNVTVTAYDNSGLSGTQNLIVIAYMYQGVNVIGYNSSKHFPAYPANASMFYDNSPVVIIVNTTDTVHYSNVTANFFEADGSIPLEYNNSGVLLPDGNYSYRITHTLGAIPDQDAKIVWINVTMSTPIGHITIPNIGALVVVSNINPKEDPSTGLGGNTTNWRDIPDYSAAYLTFEPYNGSNKIATLKFNEPINLTDYTTAMNLKNLGEMLKMSGKSMDLNATADALREFNKAASLTIYNLTEFTVSPAILEDGVLVVPSGGTSGGAVVNLGWDNLTHTLSFDISHWTEYSWDGEPPTVYNGAVGYPVGQTTVRSGQSITLSATIVDSFSGVKNATVNAASIGAGTVVLNNVSGKWINTTVTVNALDGTYDLNVIAYDKVGNLNNTAQIRVIVSGATESSSITSVTITPTNPSAGDEINITVAMNNPGASFNGVVEGNVWAPDGTGKYIGWKNMVIPSGTSTATIIGAAGGARSSYITHQQGTYYYDVFLENADIGQDYRSPTDFRQTVAFTVGAADSAYMSNIVLSASPTIGSAMTLAVTISNPTASAFTGTMNSNIWDSASGHVLTPQSISIAAGGSQTLTFSYTPVRTGLHSYDFFMVSAVAGQNDKAPWSFSCMDYLAGIGFTVV